MMVSRDMVVNLHTIKHAVLPTKSRCRRVTANTDFDELVNDV